MGNSIVFDRRKELPPKNWPPSPGELHIRTENTEKQPKPPLYRITIDPIVGTSCYRGALEYEATEWATCTGPSMLAVLDMLTAELEQIDRGELA